MTTWKQVNVSDTWIVGEVHVGKIWDTYWVIEAKLSSGRVARMFRSGPRPDVSEEADLLRQLMRKDRWNRITEGFADLWRKMTRCYFCNCDDSW